MNKTERDALRSLLRSRFKVLRADVAAREAELLANLDCQLDERFAAEEGRYDDLMYQAQLAIDETNRKLNDIGRELHGVDAWGKKTDRKLVMSAGIESPVKAKRSAARREAVQAIRARVERANLELQRQENDLIIELMTGVLESAEAKAFFDRIPKVSELVPAYRLAELSQ